MLAWPLLLVGLSVVSAQRRPPFFPSIPNKPSVGTTTPAPPKNATYWVSYSDSLIPGQNLDFRVALLKNVGPVAVTVTLMNSAGNKTILTTQGTVVYSTISTISLPIPFDVERPSSNEYDRRYRVRVDGRGRGFVFMKEDDVMMKEKALTVFVQTDKAIYKPGQKVKFRIMALTPDLKAVNSPIDIIIKDPKKNRIFQKKGSTDPTGFGVVEHSLQLADRVPTGQWKIEARIQGQLEEKMFDVKQYRLPKFEVEIETPPFGLTSDFEVPVTVRAKYTFGEPVIGGNIKVTMSRMYQSRPTNKPFKRGKLNRRGELTVRFSKSEILEYLKATNKYITSLKYQNIQFDATVVEPNTRRSQKADTSPYSFYSTPVDMQFLSISPNSFKSGLGYTGYLEVLKKDKTLFSPEESSRINVRVNVTYTVPLPKEPTTTTTTTTTVAPPAPPPRPIDSSISEIVDVIMPPGPLPYERTETKILDVLTQVLPSTGWITLNFPVPEEATTIAMSATVLEFAENDQDVAYKSLSQAHSPTDSFLQLLVPPRKFRVGDVLPVNAKSTHPFTVLNVQVYSKSLLVHTETITANTAWKEVSFDISLTQAMSPSVKIVAFYIREDNSEFVVDALNLNVDGLFAKNVSVEFSKAKVKPGDNVDVKVKAEAGSRVYLLSNDKSVLLLKKGNDITQEMVQSALISYDYGYWHPWMRYMVICGWPSYLGGSDASTTLSSASVTMMTDGLIYKKKIQNPWLYRNFAMPVAMASPEMASDRAGPPPVADQAPDRVRKLFPENWLWTSELVTSGNNELTIPSTAPDTITTWVTTVFSMHPEYGLSVAEQPAELTTFQDLFVSLDLPLSIVRDEEYCFTASLFSYYPQPISAVLTLEKSDHYDSIYLRHDQNVVSKRRTSGHYSYLKGYVEENDVESVMYCFIPTTVGKVPVVVGVNTNVPGLNDAVQRIINVKADGSPRSTTNSYLVDLSEGPWTQEVDVSFLNETVEGSQYITISTAGNLMGPILENLDDLLRKPYGCGEQNMLNFAPNIFLLEFYFKTGLLDEKKLETAKEYMLIGYSKEILYEHGKTGGYSTFGNNDDTDKPASLWLTAFVTKCFAQAEQLNSYQEVLRIDLELISRSVMWMASQQSSNGSFVERGRVFNKGMQGGSAKGQALTAYTMIAFHEAQQVFEKSGTHEATLKQIKASLAKGQSYLLDQLRETTDPYDICIVAYVLHLIDSRAKNMAYNNMIRAAKSGDGLMFWKRKETRSEPRYYWSTRSDAISVEATSYALLTMAMRPNDENRTSKLPVLRWLSHQRGPNGGFYSTQDTVIGLQALTAVSAETYSTDDVPMELAVTYSDALGQVTTETKTVNKDTQLLLQKFYIPYKDGFPKTLSLSGRTLNGINAQTAVLAEVVLEYNVENTTETPVYAVDHKFRPVPYGYLFSVNIRTTDGQAASMTILEMDIPAGFDPDTELLRTHRSISDVEILDDRLVLYFDTDAIDGRGINVQISLKFTKGVLIASKPKYIRVYNYYEPNEEVTVLFDLGSEENICSKAKSFSICPYV